MVHINAAKEQGRTKLDTNRIPVRVRPDIVRQERQAQGLKQRELADKTELSLRLIQTSEGGGEISLSSLRQIADTLGVPVAKLTDDPVASTVRGLTEDLAKGDFEKSKGRGSAQCCAFLVGDFSVLKTKRALVTPIDSRVRVAIDRTGTKSISIRVYERKAYTWVPNETYEGIILQALETAFESPSLRKWFPWCPFHGLDVRVFSDVPFGAVVHEDSAFALAFAAALQDLARQPQNEHQTLRFAGAVLSHWYAYPSWAGLASAQCGPGELFYFDRSGDGGVDLVALATRRTSKMFRKDFERNAYLPPRCWEKRSHPMRFDVDKFSVWLRDIAPSDIDDPTRYQEPIKELDKVVCGFIIDRMRDTLLQGGEDCGWRIGLLMKMHHDMLALAGFIDRDFHELVSLVNGVQGVLGAKSAIGRGNGAILVLTERPVEGLDDVRKRMHDLRLTRIAPQNQHDTCGIIRSATF